MAREGITPAGHAGFETDISLEETESLLRGFLEALVEEQHRGRKLLPESAELPPAVNEANR